MLKKSIAFFLACAAILGLATGCSQDNNNKNDNNINDDKKTSAQNNVVFTAGNSVCYNSGSALFCMSDDNNLKTAMMKNDDGQPEIFDFGPVNNILTDNKLYGSYNNSENLVCWDLSDTSHISCTSLYVKETIGSMLLDSLQNENSSVTYEDMDMLKTAFVCSVNYPSDGGSNIYFPITYDRDYYSAHKPLQFRIVEAAKNGRKIKLLPDVHASSLVVSDEYIYYYENGFDYTKETFDIDVCGIYKMKTDGSEKEKLTDCKPAFDNMLWYRPAITICGNDLYFIDKNDKDENYLKKFSLDSKKVETISKEQCSAYYVDQASDTVFYTSENSDYVNTLYTHDLSNHKEKKLSEITDMTISDPLGLCVYEKYVYVCTSPNSELWTYTNDFNIQSPDNIPVGLRLDKKTGDQQKLYCLRNQTGQQKSMIYWK